METRSTITSGGPEAAMPARARASRLASSPSLPRNDGQLRLLRLIPCHFMTNDAVADRTQRHVWARLVEMGESRTPRPEPFARDQLRACPMLCRRSAEPPSAWFPSIQSRVPGSGLVPDYATLVRAAASLHDAFTTRETEVASTLTLLPKQRGRESTGGCQVLRFAACLTRPDGTSARVL